MKYRKNSLLIGTALAVLLIFGSLLASPSARTAIANAFGSTPQTTAAGPAAEVYTAGITAENAFHWLDPIAPGSGDTSNLDASLLNYLSVEVCEVAGSGCTAVRTFNSAGTSAEQLRIVKSGSNGGYFIVNWDTQKARISLTKTYRIVVSIPGLQLGSIDLAPVTYRTFGRTWPIKFLVENNPVIRVRIMRYRGKSASLIASALRSEFGLTEEEIAALLAGDTEPFTQAEIEVALAGVFQEDVIVPPTTKVSDEGTSSLLKNYSAETGTLVFGAETPFLKNVKAGDVLVGEPTAASPYGYLRKVTSKRKDNGQIILETSQGTLADAVYQGKLDARAELRAADLDFEEVPTEDGAFQRVAQTEPRSKLEADFQTADVGGGYEFFESFDETFDFDSGKGDYTGTGKVRVTGSISFNAGYDFGWGAEFCGDRLPPVCVDRVEAHLGVTQTSRVHVTGDLKGTLHKEKVVKRKYYKPIAFMIGPIPVWIVPIVDVVVGADGNADVRFDFDASVTTAVSVGAKWTDPGDGGNDWEGVSTYADIQKDAHLNDFKLNMRLTGYGKGKGKLLIYGVAGPTLDVAVGGGFEFHIPGNPVWKVYGHIRGDVKFEVSILGVIDLAEFSQKVLLEEPVIIKSDNLEPFFQNVKSPITVFAGVETFLGPSATTYDVIDPEGETSLALTATSTNPNDPMNTFPRVTFTEPGERTLTITATDSGGKSGTTDIVIRVPNQPPDVDLYPSTDSIPATAQFFVTVLTKDPDRGTRVGCTSIQMTSSSGDAVTRRGASGNCVALVKFTKTGTQSVSVLATDQDGASTPKTVFVNVTPAPANPYPEIVLGTGDYQVTAYRGPIAELCIPDYPCETPSGSTLKFGTPDPNSGFYYLPMLMLLSATDYQGNQPDVAWKCESGVNTFPVVEDPVYKQPSCSPAYSATGPVKIYAVLTDSLGQQLRTEPRIYFMLPSGPN